MLTRWILQLSSTERLRACRKSAYGGPQSVTLSIDGAAKSAPQLRTILRTSADENEGTGLEGTEEGRVLRKDYAL